MQATKSKKTKSKTVAVQRGTGPHFDVNPHNLWKKQLKQHPKTKKDFAPLDRWRPFQSQVVLRDQKENDSSLEVLPGIHTLAEAYYRLGIPAEGLNVARRGAHSCHLYKSRNAEMLDKFVYVRRIPGDWSPKGLPETPSKERMQKMTRKDMSVWIQQLKDELTRNLGELPQEGDFILWDIRTAHTTGDRNDSGQTRQTFYHAYLTNDPLNDQIVKEIRERRATGLHPPDFPKAWAKIEMSGYKPAKLSQLGKKLYGYVPWQLGEEESEEPKAKRQKKEEEEEVFQLTDLQIEFYKRYGFVVIPNTIDRAVTTELRQQIDSFLKKKGIDASDVSKIRPQDWEKVAAPFGGMLELYWLPKMEEIRQHPNPYLITSQLLEATWASGKNEHFEHPFEPLNSKHLSLYVDRCNMRFPGKDESQKESEEKVEEEVQEEMEEDSE